MKEREDLSISISKQRLPREKKGLSTKKDNLKDLIGISNAISRQSHIHSLKTHEINALGNGAVQD